MKIHSLVHEYFKLDGGAMFGVVPKTIWQRTNPADENNLIGMAARSLLIEDKNRLILIDTGLGTKQSEKFFGYYKPSNRGGLDKKLHELGFSRNDITDIFLTHLHFDHCGGAVIRKDEKLIPAFPNAKYWSNEAHWQWAIKPNRREKASFLKENFVPLQEYNRLHFVPLPGKEKKHIRFNELNMDIIFVSGHTDMQMLPLIRYKGKTLVFMADLLPTTGHIPLPYVMAYDTRPLITLDEKETLLNQAADEGWYLFLEHDPVNEICTVKHTEKGVRLDKTLTLEEFKQL